MEQASWWERRWFLALLVLGSALPLLLPETPPLMDLPGHMGRYRVQLDLAHSADLQRYYDFHWALIGNLGVDLLVIPLSKLIGLEPAVKLIVLTIPPLTVTGLFWIAKEIHGRIPPTAMFAIPFIYSHPFNFGFINFALSVALAFNAFGLWLTLTRHGRFRIRAAAGAAISCLVWVTHTFGWGVLGLLTFSTELVRERDGGKSWRNSAANAAVRVLPLAIPLIFMVVWRSGDVGGKTDQLFSIISKLLAVVATMRDRWLIWDSFGVASALLLIGAAIYEPRLSLSRKLALPAAVLATAFLLMPGRVFGSAYADMRLAPLGFMMGLLAIQTTRPDPQADRTLAWLGLTFVTLRLAGNFISFEIADRQLRGWLHALDHIPQGVPVLWLQGDYCGKRWEVPRYAHVGSFVITRRNGFSNDQWQVAQLLRVRYWEAGYFKQDPSAFIYSEKCVQLTEEKSSQDMFYDHRLSTAKWRIPWKAFDYVWLMQIPDLGTRPPLTGKGTTLIWQGDGSYLYRVDHTKGPEMQEPPASQFGVGAGPGSRPHDTLAPPSHR